MAQRKTVDLSWFDYTPEVLVFGQVKRVLSRYKLKVPDFRKYMEGKAAPIVDYPNGDLELGVLREDLRKYLKNRLKGRKV